jgi:ribosome-associated protein
MPGSAIWISGSAMAFELPEDALEERFLAASGPGGQNVNKVATACQLRCDVFRLGLAPDVYSRLKTLAGSRMTAAGEIVLTARKYRTQEANRADARARLAELIDRAHVQQAKRKRTRPSRAAKAKRVDAKKQRGSVKQTRGKVQLD